MENKLRRAPLKGERKHNQVTFNPTKAKMGEKLYVTIPYLDNSLSILPGTTHLIYNFKNSNDKSWPLNNMNRLFVQGLQIKLGRDIVYDNVGESVYRVYEDLWLPKEKRDQMTGLGIGSEEMRKSLAGTSGASTSSTTNGFLDKTTAEIMENQRISLGQIINDHGLHNPGKFDTKYTITLPDASTSIADKLSGQAVGDFTLENLQLEYDTIMNSSAVDDQKNEMAGGKNYIIKHVSQESVTNWDKDATLINENLHINRESLKAIVFLYKWTDQIMDETYVYPNITEISCNVNGKPNIIHSSSVKPESMFTEAKRFFGDDKTDMSVGKFFSTAFCAVLDFWPFDASANYNDGVNVDGNSGIQITFKRKATAKDVKCYTFVICDSIVQIDNSGFQKTLI